MMLRNKLFGRNKIKTIGFWAGDENNFQFVDSLIEALSQKYKVKKYNYFGDKKLLEQQLGEVDLAWFEWATDPLISATNMKKLPKIISRAHRYELYSEAPRRVSWSRIDLAIFSSPSMLQRFENTYSDEFSQTKETLYLPIGVDLSKFAFEDKDYSKELLYVGRVHPHKNPCMLLQVMHEVVKRDSDYHLTIVGEASDELYQQYVDDQLHKLNLKSSVSLLGKLEQGEVVKRMNRADHILTTSIIEGVSQSSLEAMACGAGPIVSNYYGASLVYEAKDLFLTPSEAATRILKAENDRRANRVFIEEDFNFDKTVDVIEDRIEKIL
ncbi:glycosyltransferase family 4 protein [Candidatus Saccharibacteria bacterium]|nr:glycosyltransferase family 4 protein [Candidatus Saccharibacteria bacterium]